jgi:repressor LexA
MTPTPLTEKQQNFFSYLKRKISDTGHAPSLRQAATDLGISHTAVASLLHTLEQKGWVQRDGHYSRTIRLFEQPSCPSSGREIPIVGQVAAGLPLYAQQEWAGNILVDSRVYRGANLFALQVRGDSMQDAGILHGDLAICEPRQFAENGEIIVALINNEEATIKRFYYRGDHIELKPENTQYTSMRYGLGEVLIQGRVIGIHRGPAQMLMS